METLLENISSETKNCFLIGLTSFLRFYGEEELRNYLRNIINMSISGHVVVMTYQCQKLLSFSDLRLSRRIFLYDGEAVPFPKLTFVSKELPVPSCECVVDGIDEVADKIEKNSYSDIFVVTSKNKKYLKNPCTTSLI